MTNSESGASGVNKRGPLGASDESIMGVKTEMGFKNGKINTCTDLQEKAKARLRESRVLATGREFTQPTWRSPYLADLYVHERYT